MCLVGEPIIPHSELKNDESDFLKGLARDGAAGRACMARLLARMYRVLVDLLAWRFGLNPLYLSSPGGLTWTVLRFFFVSSPFPPWSNNGAIFPKSLLSSFRLD